MDEQEAAQKAVGLLAAILANESDEDFGTLLVVALDGLLDFNIPFAGGTPEEFAQAVALSSQHKLLSVLVKTVGAYQHLAIAHDAGRPQAASELLQEYALLEAREGD
jgi:hypothetical protein